MATSRDANDGWGKGVGVAILGVLVLSAMVPPPVWIFLGIVVVGTALTVVVYKCIALYESRLEAEAAAARSARQENARRERQWRSEALGAKNAALVESALAAVKHIAASEASRAGWLGDVDFTTDITAITDCFQKAHALRRTAGDLSALDNPGIQDRKILAEAKATAANLECAACERVELIAKCAKEAQLIDESLRKERKDARTAEQRATLHAELSAMLYGIEAAPDATPASSAADAVMARVQAYREIKQQIERARDGDTR